jgi:vacuolar-type H+-ATPase subunit I/STV1
VTTRKATKRSTKSTAASNEDGVITELETVRDILFGQQVRQHQQKHAELETLVNSSVQQLRDEMNSMSLEINARIDQVCESLAAEEQQRVTEIQGVNENLQAIESSIAQLEAACQTTDNDLQDQLLNHADQVKQQQQQLHDELTEALRQAVEKLSRDKADRTSLASLLSGIANQLSETEAAGAQSS